MTGVTLEQLEALINKPEALAAFEKRKKRTAPPVVPRHRPANLDRAKLVERASAYIRKMGIAIWGGGGDNQTFKVACRLIIDFDLSIEEAWPVIAEWNQSCEPPWCERLLRRKLNEADKQPGERGKLAYAERPDRTPAPADTPRLTTEEQYAEFERAGLCGGLVEPYEERVRRAGPTCGKANCATGCACRVQVALLGEKGLREQLGREGSPPAPTPPPHPHAELLRYLIGSQPYATACPRKRPRHLNGKGEWDALIEVACGCWGCYQCRLRTRWNEKKTHVPIALKHGTHTWSGTQDEWAAVRKRLERTGTTYGYRWVRRDDTTWLVVLAVAPDSPTPPDDIPGLCSTDGEGAARALALAIDHLPADLPSGTRKFGLGGTWKALVEAAKAAAKPEQKVDAGSGSGGAGGEAVVTRDDDTGFTGDTEAPVTSLDSFADFLAANGIPHRWGVLDDWHAGGSVVRSIIYERPVDPEMNKEIRRRLFEIVHEWPSDDPIPD